MNRNAVRSCLKPGHRTDRVDQSLPVMQTGTPHQGAVNIEKD